MVGCLRLGKRLIACCALWLALWPAAADAAVEIRFYSKELGASFPHAFVELEGQDDRTGEKVHANYGFTAKALSPAILMGSVTGDVMSVSLSYVRSSDRHFSFVLSDAEYDEVKATIAKWRGLKQPSYNLNRQNCVFFVGDVAASLGMRAETPKALMKKPRSYIESLATANRSWLASRGALLGARYAGNGK
jgi:hypothetical protein